MDNWRTPPEVFVPLNAEFNFDLDAAADESNALVRPYLTNALNMADWPGSRIWLNPPYGKMLEPFVRRAAEEAAKNKVIVVLIPLRARAAWWHEAVIAKAVQLRFVRKRVRFLMPNGERGRFTGSCDSVIVIFHGDGSRILTVRSFIQEVA